MLSDFHISPKSTYRKPNKQMRQNIKFTYLFVVKKYTVLDICVAKVCQPVLSSNWFDRLLQ